MYIIESKVLDVCAMVQIKIENLTPEQESLITVIRDEWIKIGLDTSPTDKQQAEAAIRLAYECAGFTSPQQILWFNNPQAAVTWLVSSEYIVRYPTLDGIRNVVEEAAKEAIKNAVELDVRRVIRKAIEYDMNEVSDVEEAVKEAVDEAARDIVWDIIKDEDTTAWDSVSEAIDNAFWGFDVGWLAFFAYFDAIGIDCSKLKGLWASTKHCGCWWAFENLAVITPKPSAIRLDAQGRLHAEGVPAVAYEGFVMYAFHGVRRLPEQ
jgi:hypothetical protein